MAGDIIELTNKGILRVLRGLEGEGLSEENQIVQGFRLGEYEDTERYITSWSPMSSELRVAVGSEHSLQVWDLGTARKKTTIATGISASLTCMDYETTRGNLSVLGFEDGTVALYDMRQSKARRCIARWTKGHDKGVLACCLTASQEIASTGYVSF